MRRICLAVSLFVLSLGCARAAGYDDFARGIGANAQGDAALAIASFTAAIAAPDLSPNLLPTAYRGRGVAYLRQNKCKLALGDLETAVTLKPADIDATSLRGAARACVGQDAGALADFAAVIATKPDAQTYRQRGLLLFRMRDFTASAGDFAHAARLAPSDAYAVLWQVLARLRGGVSDPAANVQGIDHLYGGRWPEPVVAFYGGRTKPEDVYAGVTRHDGVPLAEQQCEADFYIAEWWLARQDMAAAKPLLEKVMQACPHDFVEYAQARIELELLP